MKRFRYAAYNPTGQRVVGETKAESSSAAMNSLIEQGLQVTELKELSSTGLTKRVAWPGARQLDARFFETLFSELAPLLAGGVRIDAALAVIESGRSVGTLQQNYLAELLVKVRSGGQFSHAMEQMQPRIDSSYLALLRASEDSGQITQTMQGIAEELRYRMELRSALVQAAAYPAVILSASLLSVWFLLANVVPRLSTLFDGVPDIPTYTSMLLSTSEFMLTIQWPLVILLFGASVLMAVGWHNPRIRQIRQAVWHNLPGFRSFRQDTDRIRLTAAMAQLLAAGIPIDKSLALALESVQESTLRGQLTQSLDALRQGRQLSNALADTQLFDMGEQALLRVGEESGTLADVLSSMAARQQSRFSARLKLTMTLVEPVMILLTGLIVGGIVLTMMMSITSINNVGF